MAIVIDAGSESTVGTSVPVLPMIIRGRVIEDDLVEFMGRGDSMTFMAPNPALYVDQLALKSPGEIRDLYELRFDEILDYLEELGQRLDVATNEHMQWARELTYLTSSSTKPLIDKSFETVGGLFHRDVVQRWADASVGLDYLNGWVDTTLSNGQTFSVRAFGARGLHIIPGNSAAAGASTLIQCAFLRSDCIIKSPSNGPFFAAALGQTMCEMAPDHPITKHLAVAYWRGGDIAIEDRLCQPTKIEKIVAWGGFASVKHITRYIQPGLELIALDPKTSASVIGADALVSDEAIREAALRLAVDVGTRNQQACTAARVAYVITDDIDVANRFGGYVYEELMGLPPLLSTKPKSYDAELRSHVDSIRLQDDFYNVIGGEDGEGCVIVSQLSDPVAFTSLLADRTVNIVPVDTIDEVLSRFDAYTGVVGVHPESIKTDLTEIAPLYGVQRFVPLGYTADKVWGAPHDCLELERRMCKWVLNQSTAPIPLTYASTRETAPPIPENSMSNTLEALRAPGPYIG